MLDSPTYSTDGSTIFEHYGDQKTPLLIVHENIEHKATAARWTVDALNRDNSCPKGSGDA